MMQTVTVQGIDVEVELRYRIEIQQWQATLHHPTLGFTVSEWAGTGEEATKAARRAMRLYEAEMTRTLVGVPRRDHLHPAPTLRRPPTARHNS
jgi:hypothetical protein